MAIDERAWALTILSLLAASGAAEADVLTATRGQPVVETAHAVTVEVEDGLATIKVLRSYENRGQLADQVEMVVSLPWETVATGLRIKGKSRWYDGELMEAGMAAVVYESLTGFGPWQPKDPAILFWEALGELGLWIFPVNPSAVNTVEYTMIQPMAYRDGRYYMKYPAYVDQPELAVPTLRVVVRDGKKSQVWVNGEKVAQAKAVPIASRLLETEDVDAYGPGGDPGCEAGEWDDEWYEASDLDGTYPFCRGSGEALVAVQAPEIDTVETRLGVFDLSTGASVVRLEVDAAPLLRPRPKKASVVFVVDGSHSFTREGIEAALELASAFVTQLPDARYEVVVFRRRAERLLGDMVTAKGWKEALDGVPDGRLEPGNGSSMDAGLVLAASILESRKGPRRIVVITDSLMRQAYMNVFSDKALSGLDAIVHVVDLAPGSPGEEAWAERDDGHELAPVALGHGGILVGVSEGRIRKDYQDAARDLIRPWKIDDFAILAGEEPLADIDVPDVLPEGKGLRYTFISSEVSQGGVEAPAFVTLVGRIWAEPFVRIVPAGQEMSEKVVPALVFATEIYWELDEIDQMRAATAGGAVSPLTSYLSIEPGVRPSTAGFLEGEGGLGSLGSVGFGAGGGMGSGYGVGVGVVKPDYAAVLEALAREATAPCFQGAQGVQDPGARLECTYDEIVDVEVDLDGEPDLATCVEDALWSIRLPAMFVETVLEATVRLG